MNQRAAKRAARHGLALTARSVAASARGGQLDVAGSDADRLARAYTELADWLDPQPLSTAVDADQLAFDLGTPDA